MTGAGVTAAWDPRAGTYISGTNVLTFAGFNTPTGGSGADTCAIATLLVCRSPHRTAGAGNDDFVFSAGKTLTGSIDGGSGTGHPWIWRSRRLPLT